MSYTVNQLLSVVKTRAGLPSTQATAANYLSDTEILELAEHEQWSTITSLLRSAETYGVEVSEDTPIVSGTDLYSFPRRAQNRGAIAVWYVDNSGNTFEMEQIALADSWNYRNSGSSSQSKPYIFAIEREGIRILPTPTQSVGYIRMYYWDRFPRMVLTTGNVASVLFSTGNQIVLTADAPTAWQAGGVDVDVLDSREPHKYVWRDQRINAVSEFTTFFDTLDFVDSDIKYEAEASYYRVVDAGYSPYLMIPFELHQILITATVRAVCETLRDEKGMALAERSLDRAIESAQMLLKPRVRTAPQTLIQRKSPLRGGR